MSKSLSFISSERRAKELLSRAHEEEGIWRSKRFPSFRLEMKRGFIFDHVSCHDAVSFAQKSSVDNRYVFVCSCHLRPTKRHFLPLSLSFAARFFIKCIRPGHPLSLLSTTNPYSSAGNAKSRRDSRKREIHAEVINQITFIQNRESSDRGAMRFLKGTLISAMRNKVNWNRRYLARVPQERKYLAHKKREFRSAVWGCQWNIVTRRSEIWIKQFRRFFSSTRARFFVDSSEFLRRV